MTRAPNKSIRVHKRYFRNDELEEPLITEANSDDDIDEITKIRQIE